MPMNLLRRHATSALVALLLSNLALQTANAGTISWVTVGDPGNPADSSLYGNVSSSFQIMQYEWTNSLYAEFLNAVDPNGTNPNDIYNSSMGTNVRGGISFTSGAAAGSKYAVKTDMGDKPVNYVSWFDAARVANWLQNGQGSGSTETGAYTLNNATTGNAPAVNAGAQFYLPTENQWYKAAYYKSGGTNAGYWAYTTGSDTAPTAVSANSTGVGSAGNTGNFVNAANTADWNGENGNVTTVGTNGGPSPYNTFDMGGNVSEWNDLTGLIAGSARGTRGGNWSGNVNGSLFSTRAEQIPTNETNGIGFRLASSAVVPEPSTWVMGLAGIACGGWQMLRRRRAQ